MEEYFEVAFVMDKIDMVGLPTLEAGPMENRGPIFYLHDPDLDAVNTNDTADDSLIKSVSEYQTFGRRTIDKQVL